MFPSIWRCSNPNGRTRQYRNQPVMGAAELDREYAGMSKEPRRTGPSVHVTLALIVKRDFRDHIRA
jgi:hypothetical protein